MNIEEFDKAMTKAADEFIAGSAVIQKKWAEALDILEAASKDLPEHLVQAVIAECLNRIEKGVDDT